jgi:hypothetical protein
MDKEDLQSLKVNRKALKVDSLNDESVVKRIGIPEHLGSA